MKKSDILSLPVGRHADGNGLYLNVQEKNGTVYRSWLVRTQVNKKTFVRSLGTVAQLTLLQAREKAKQVIADLKSGIDPSETKPTAPTREEQKERSFAVVAKKAIETRAEVSQWKNEKHHAQWFSTVETYAVPILGGTDVEDITRDDVLKVLLPIWKTKTDTAKRLRGRLETIFGYAIRHGLRTKENPARWKDGLEFDLPKPAVIHTIRHQEAPTLSELQNAVPDLIRVRRSNVHGGLCALFGVLTACRVNEFVAAKWEEIDLKKKVFSVPPERRKDKKKYPHRVPLPDQAIALLERIGVEPEGYIFKGRDSTNINLETPKKTLRDSIHRPVTAHGCRSTFRDWCAENHVDSVLAEKSLMHATGNETEQAYQRSDLLEQRRPIMQAWADVLFKNVEK